MEISCRIALMSAILGFQLVVATHLPTQGSCNFLDTINVTSGRLDQYKNLHHNGMVFQKGTFEQYDYVMENGTEMKVEPHIRGCVCGFKPCIRVCCMVENDNHNICVSSTASLSIPTQDEDEESSSISISMDSKDYEVLVGRPCGQMYRLEPQDYTDDRWIFSNGSIILESGSKAGHQEYCFGQSKNGSQDPVTDVYFCFYGDNDVTRTLYPIGMIFSLPFLFITFCVYGFIPELRNLHGKSLMCYVFSLSTLYIGLSVVQLEGELFWAESIPCIFTGYMIYISVLLCFFWLNVMCYDIWSTFKDIRGRGSERKRFMFYSMYAIGVPLFLTSIVFCIDRYSSLDDRFKPLIGITRCWIQHSRIVEAMYTYAPISVILVVNIALYSITACTISRVLQETSVIRNGESQKHSKSDADKDRFYLYLRLFIVMGATWSMESISWVFPHSFFFYASDILNCLQGFIIFILFVWKPKVRKLLVKRYRSFRKLPPTASSAAYQGASSRTESSRISHDVKELRDVRDKAEKPILGRN